MTDDSLLGKEYAGYRLLSRLAEGGMGVVYLGEHTTLGRRAAVKVLKLEHCRDEGSVNRFLKEAQAVNAIGHDGIVDIYDFGRDPDGRAFFVMELLEGEPLSRRLGRDRVTWAEAVPIIAGTVRPLAAAHDKGFVHRDLKPDNIWLSYDPFSGKVGVKLLDFGIAKLVGEEAPKERLTRTGAIIGTPHYMAPEQINNQPIDGRTDVYAFGVILHEMLTGAPPYAGDTLAAVLMGHLLNDVPRLVPRPEQKVPPWVPGTVMRMLAKEPAGRPESIRAALAELEGGRTEVTAPVPAQKPPGARRRRRWPWAVLAGSLVVGAGALVAVQQRAPAPAAVADAAPRAIVAAPPDASPRAAAVIDYEKLRAEAQALLRGTLRAGEPAVRAGGSDALGEVRDAPSLPALVELAGADADLEVRAHAAGAAGTIGLDGKQSAALAALEKDAPAPLQVWYAEAQARPATRKRGPGWRRTRSPRSWRSPSRRRWRSPTSARRATRRPSRG
jgi:tRNA A-37 threonylcarbamoyl transferase component Bud32